MPALYRICLPTLPFIKPVGLRNPGFVTDQVFSVNGPEAQTWAPILDILIPGFTPYSFNYSIIDGNFEKGTCQHLLHKNISDIVFMPADLPINDKLIDIYGVIGQSKIQFQSSYNYIDKARNVDVMESLLSFKLSLWLLILVLIFFLAWLFKSKQSRTWLEYLIDYMDRLDQVTTHFIGQNSIEGKGFCSKLLIITLSFFSLMINQYYNGLIHTDLVVPEVPKVPYSYEDFASTATVSGFPTGTSMLNYLEESPQDSPERNLYNELRRRNVTICDEFPVKKLYWAKNKWLRMIYKNLYRLREHYVSIGSQIHLTSLLTRICFAKVYSLAPEMQRESTSLKGKFVTSFKNRYPWISSDPNTQSTLHAFIKRKEFTPDTKIWKRVKRSIDHGMYQRIIWTAETLDLIEDFPDEIKKRTTQTKDCKEYSRKLKIKEVGFQDLKAVNFEKFARAFLILYSVCYMALIVEVYVYTYSNRE